MHQEFDPGNVGEELGLQSIERIIANVEAYCTHEERRISLKNQSEILALRAEFSRLLKEERSLEERLSRAPTPGEDRTARRKSLYHWTVASVLTLAGFVFSVLSFDPFRFGRKGYLYCLGIGVVTPFLVEKIIDVWNAKTLKSFVAVAGVAALISLGMLAVIRGDLFAEQFKDANAPVVIDDESHAPQAENTFYENTVPLLRIAMVLLAFAMELGAGLALHEAWKSLSDVPENWGELERALRDVRGRMTELVYEITKLQNEPAVFSARFWRNFYRAVLTHTGRRAAMKVILAAVLILPFARCHAAESVTLVVAVDLTQSVAGKEPGGRTDFEKNSDGVAALLATVPASCRIVILGITDRSFANPYILLSARVADDPGYFGERLAAARRALLSEWKRRITGVTPQFLYTDIFGGLLVAEHLFQESPQSAQKILVVFSDMRHHTKEVDLESVPAVPRWSVLPRKGVTVAALAGVDVYVLGVDGDGKSVPYWQSLNAFWAEYFKTSGTRLKSYSPLRDLRLFGK